MSVDIEKLEALAKAATKGPWFSGGTWVSTERGNSVADCARGDEKFIAAANPTAVLELIADQKRMASRLLCCTKCGGQGELCSGRTSYEGYNQPPEPIMDKCGDCDGAGVLGDERECLSILDELEQVKAENAGLKTGYEAYERVNAELRAECEALREIISLVTREIPHSKSVRPGDAPGHCHSVPGVWDKGNGEKAGKECAWCKVWNAAIAIQKDSAQ
ncbi:hypothetical protein [Pseudomonas savastanoi]|uniref:Uncharacterized protein n=1 Tax=Pseudomonas savastanoi TaxID=29438 RepID=A0AAW3LXX8_PSESS|nr:hypothetical protein [Pseudomonas savastanoi]KTC59088.1 hypothetical protein AO287_21590 [Pseudomonas savastanoi]